MRFVLIASKRRYIGFLTIVSTISIIIFTAFFSVYNVIPVAAADSSARWTKVNIPAEGEAGGWALAPGSDIKLLTMAVDRTMYAYGAGLTYTLLKSTDGGIKWSCIGQVQDSITDIAVSRGDTNIVYYTTAGSIYRSADGGKRFSKLPDISGGAGPGNVEITSIDCGWINGNIIAVGTRDTGVGEFGGVYLFDESVMMPVWEDAAVGNYDVYDVAFSPAYAVDRQIIAAVTDETDSYVFNKTGDASWNSFIGRSKILRDNNGVPASLPITGSAALAFPDDYDVFSNLSGSSFFIGINTGAGLGDVFKITAMEAPAGSLSTDLNAGGIYEAGNMDVTGLSVRSDTGNTVILAGTAGQARAYISMDGGINWIKNRKAPTGESNTYVLLDRDFSTTGIMYAATGGSGSAVSVSRDLSNTWNQISLIDTAAIRPVDIVLSPEYGQDNSLFMVTFGNGPGTSGLWRTTNGGLNWERILSGSNPAVDTINRIGLPPQFGAECKRIFASGESGGLPVIWESDDAGQSFRARITGDPVTGLPFPVDTWAIAGEKTIFIGSYNETNGVIYRTDNAGFTYNEGTPAGAYPLYSIAFSPDFSSDGIIIVGNRNGQIFHSNDSGNSFLPLTLDTSSTPPDGFIDIIFSPELEDGKVIYASSSGANTGIYRFNLETSSYWERIDGTLPVNASIVHLVISGGGVLYGINSTAGGGMERCLNPGSAGPVFETVTLGLNTGAILTDIEQTGGKIWALDTANNKLMTYHDTLTSPVILSSPVNGASGAGSMANHLVKNISLDWEPVESAASYEWQCAYNNEFSSIPAGLQSTVSGSSVQLPALEPATAYNWRVRVKTPVLSPWSEVRSFSTYMDTEVVELRPETPIAGATGVPIKPVFQWTAVVGATSYELLVAADSNFENPVIIKINDYALPSNAWECDVSLDFETTYFWKVKAITDSTHSPWSSTGVFTTGPFSPVEKDPFEEVPELRLLESQDHTMNLPLPTQSALLPPPADNGQSAPFSAPVTMTVSSPANTTQTDIPPWLMYIIGGLMAIVMMALIIILAVVLKIRRF